MTEQETVKWDFDKDGQLVCQLLKPVSPEQFEQVEQVFAQNVGGQFGKSFTAYAGSRKVVVHSPTPWLALPGTVYRHWITYLVEKAVNGAAK